MMRAYSTASGGVIFVPDEIERKANKTSYRDYVEVKDRKKPVRILSKNKASSNKITKAA